MKEDSNLQICKLSIQAYKRHMVPGLRKDSLGHLIAARDEESGTGLSDEQLAANAAIFLFAGILLFHILWLN